jgi:hypothetical protein
LSSNRNIQILDSCLRRNDINVAPPPSAQYVPSRVACSSTLGHAQVRRRKRFALGIAYTEVLLSSIILAVIIVSAMKLFANLGRSRQGVVGQDAANYLALQMIEEIKQQRYNDLNEPLYFGSESGEDAGPGRSLFDDVDDYEEWSASPPQDRNGNDLNEFADYTRSVAVDLVTANDFTVIAVTGDEGFKRVIITITRLDYEGEDEVVAQDEYVIADAPGVLQR